MLQHPTGPIPQFHDALLPRIPSCNEKALAFRIQGNIENLFHSHFDRLNRALRLNIEYFDNFIVCDEYIPRFDIPLHSGCSPISRCR